MKSKYSNGSTRIDALILGFSFIFVIGTLNSGCLPAYPNKPLSDQVEYQLPSIQEHDHELDCQNKKLKQPRQYRFGQLCKGEGNSNDIFVCVSLSGGGARAASFGYGVLKGMHETMLSASAGEEQRTLLKELDIISGSSGGSFPAASYAVWRENIFGEQFRSQFFSRHSRRFLAWLFVRPWHVFSLAMAAVDRVNVVATYCDEKAFDGKTYSDLLEDEELGDRPFLVINATNVASHQAFEFTQDDFDLLGSDLSSMPIGWATAASSAYPLVLSPLRLKYHKQPKHTNYLKYILTGTNDEENRRRREWARDLISKSDSEALKHQDDPVHQKTSKEPDYRLDEWNHKYLYLLDGGLTDNLALRYFLQELRYGVIEKLIQQRKIKHLVIISVDAAREQNSKLEKRFMAPGLVPMGYASGRSGVDNVSLILTQAINHFLVEEPKERARMLNSCNHKLNMCGCPDLLVSDNHEPEYHFIKIRLLDVDDQHLRTLSTLVSPSPEDLKKLSEEGSELLKNNPDYLALIESLGTTPAED
jgi:NTE family protein